MLLVVYKTSAKKALRKMPGKAAMDFINAFDRLAEKPDRRDLDIAKMKGRDGFRLRMGKWRALFIVTDRDIQVLDIGARGGMYKKR